jgi:hypothetical protein
MLERHTKQHPRQLVEQVADGDWPSDWAERTGSLPALISYLDLVWIDFVLHDDCILREGFNEQYYQQWMVACEGNRTSVEAVMNHMHILDFFPESKIEPTLDQVLVVGRLLREMWAAKLAMDFPGRPIVVSFPDAEQFDDLLSYEITVYQERQLKT